jgi:hypothetical protein
VVGALLLLLLSRSEKDRQSLVLPGNDDGGYMATAAVVADSTAEATADTAVHTYAAAVQGPCCAMAKNKGPPRAPTAPPYAPTLVVPPKTYINMLYFLMPQAVGVGGIEIAPAKIKGAGGHQRGLANWCWGWPIVQTGASRSSRLSSRS